MKRVLSVFLACAFLLALLPTVALAEAAPDISSTGLTINSNNVNQMVGTYQAGSGTLTVAYDGASQPSVTITMNNAALNKSLNINYLDVKLILEGENKISIDTNERALEAYQAGLTISGTGSLTIEGKYTSEEESSDLVHVDKTLNISGCTINAASNGGAAITGSDGYTITIESGANVVATGYGTAISSGQNIIVDNSTVQTNSTVSNGLYAIGNIILRNHAQIGGTSGYPTLYANGDIQITGSTVNVEATADSGIWTNGSLSIENTSNVTAKGLGHGTGAQNGITIKNSTVSASGQYGIGVLTNGDITISGEQSVVTATTEAESYGDEESGYYVYPALVTYGGSISITSGKVKAQANDAAGMEAANGITISGDTTVVDISNQSGNYPAVNVAEAFTVSGGKTKITAPGNMGVNAQSKVMVSGGELSVSSKDCGIHAPNAVVEVSGGKLSVVSSDNMAISGDSVTISGGELSVQAAQDIKPIQVGGNKLVFTGGKLTLPQINNGGKDSFQVGDKEYYLVTYDGQNGTEPKSNLVEKDSKLNPDTPQKDNHTFDGWYSAATGGEKWNLDEKTVTAHTTLYAQWTENHTHSWSLDWTTDAIGHWHECTGTGTCNIADNTGKDGYAAHTPGDWIIDRAATSSTAGQRHKACTVCGYVTATETIPATGGGGGGGGYTPPSKPSVSVDGGGGKVEAGSNGTVTITPDEGYQIEKITVNGKEVDIPADGRLTGLKPSDKVVVTFTEVPVAPIVTVEQFVDVAPGAWYYDAVKYAVDHGLFYGTSDTTFSPNSTMTRGMLATVLYRMENEPEADPADFLDVGSGQYYSEAVAWAAENGIVAGYGNGNFGPNDPITREQLATILYRYSGAPAPAGTLTGFTDADKASGYALDALRWAVEQGIIQGKGGGVLDPAGKATRAEVAAMLQRFCEKAGR